MDRTFYCCVSGCSREASSWEGVLVKSRDRVKAGFCDEHTGIPCPNIFGIPKCYGIYNKSLMLIGERRQGNEQR
jgi:hypothetical protein